MVSSTNKITNKQLDKLVIESKYHLNSLNIALPNSFVLESIVLNWNDILIAINNGFLSYQFAIEYALCQLEKSESCSKTVVDLACLFPYKTLDSCLVQSYIIKLADEVSEQEKNTTNAKLLYLVLKWVFDHRHNYVDPLGAVEIIYEDFGCPKCMASFVRYMPLSHRQLNSVASNNEVLISKWNDFLENQKATFTRNTLF